MWRFRESNTGYTVKSGDGKSYSIRDGVTATIMQEELVRLACSWGLGKGMVDNINFENTGVVVVVHIVVIMKLVLQMEEWNNNEI